MVWNLDIMDKRTKRQAKVLEDNYWDCSVCTYRNTAEAFKCLMCDIRKGTSTRKPRINSQLVAQQAVPQYTTTSLKPVKRDGIKDKTLKRRISHDKSSKKTWHPPRLKNIDRSSAQTREITVNNVTVIITEYKPKKKKSSDASSSTSEESQTDTSMDARSIDLATDSRSS
ncbi:YY1-associated factor 2 isoform X1 [Cimex lectularius]|uniref:RanBP2-type domain-containing protein n=1 Tax=Cimex lectularius TaxID=79782 RepID=A0A8I6SK95_CIMLE|nr:YY1-associated factor 2 isoform X1 [Cimex lectularius]XP_024080578.1 YY1-associated factor 2 isoform X1 [Cimex lectularius]XP_024080579.1 YY1-associated factor 2 isoform X1 [Cimex lectularius]